MSMRKILDTIRFRSFVESDVDLLGAWLRGSGLGVPEGVAAETWGRRLAQDPLILCYAVCSLDSVVGFYRLDLAPDRTAEITIIVDPGNRRLGLASAMMSEILTMARQRGVSRLLAVVEEGNRGGAEFFHGFDFEQRAPQISRYLYFERILHGAESQPPLEVTG
jgi:ribosomal protein S18 acetylase RimI-like enzyme